MPGAKQYDRTDLLDRAIELFRRQGYNGTSTEDLVRELDVNRKSMYAEFGSKQALFEAALERYSQVHLARVLGPLESPNADAASIRGAFANYSAASEGWFRGRGCLMCNTAVERAALDPGSEVFVAAYFSRIQEAFRNALNNAQRAGQIRVEADLDQLSGFLTTMFVGVAASIRAEAPSAQIGGASDTVADFLASLAPRA